MVPANCVIGASVAFSVRSPRAVTLSPIDTPPVPPPSVTFVPRSVPKVVKPAPDVIARSALPVSMLPARPVMVVPAVRLRSLFAPLTRPAMIRALASRSRTAPPLALMPEMSLKSLPAWLRVISPLPALAVVRPPTVMAPAVWLIAAFAVVSCSVPAVLTLWPRLMPALPVSAMLAPDSVPPELSGPVLVIVRLPLAIAAAVKALLSLMLTTLPGDHVDAVEVVERLHQGHRAGARVDGRRAAAQDARDDHSCGLVDGAVARGEVEVADGADVVADAHAARARERDVVAAQDAGRRQDGAARERQVAVAGADAARQRQSEAGDDAHRLVRAGRQRRYREVVGVSQADGAAGEGVAGQVAEVVAGVGKRDRAAAGSDDGRAADEPPRRSGSARRCRRWC